MKKVNLIDVTLRDGGYMNNYQFSLNQIIAISKKLEDAGINMVEIGHGYGLGAERSLGKMAHTDKEYIRGMKGKLKKSKFGMFAMAGICTSEDIKNAKKDGLDFIRIGFVGDDENHGFKKAKPLLKKALEEKLWVSANILKFNIYNLKEISIIVKELLGIGIKNIFLVDSCGGILPEETKKYVKHLLKKFNLNLGLHAHQNLDLGIANSIEAVNGGAKFIDGTLRGIGRDAGNAQIEILSAVFKRLEVETDTDLYKLIELGKEIPKIIGREYGVNEENIFLGYTKIHSMALDTCKKMGEKYSLDWRKIMEYLNKRNIKFEDPIIIEKYAKELKSSYLK